MRDDSIGLFWEDRPVERKRGAIIRAQPPIPETGWTTPRDFPNLSGVRLLSLDTETYDPDLLSEGPGFGRGKGHLVGVSIGTHDAGWYFPMRHTICPEQNIDPDVVLRWLRDTLETPHVAKIGANLLYDIGWLQEEGVDVCGPLVDVQFAEALLTEGDPVALDALASKYLGEHKETSLLYRWCADFYGGNPTDKQRGNIWRAPPSLVGPYATADARLPFGIIQRQAGELQRQQLVDLFRMECELIPLLLAMRRAGTSVDLTEAERVRELLRGEQGVLQRQLDEAAGRSVNVNASASIALAFDRFALPYPRTEKGKPSFKKEFLETVEHPIAELICGIRQRDKLCSTFIESYILNKNVNGKVHCSFHPLRGDDGGTRSGRFSSSDPNLQNIPARDERLAPLLRGIFVPDHGHMQWRRYDYSQIEYRFLAHYAVGPLADTIRAAFVADPTVDYHHQTFEMLAPLMGWDVTDPITIKYKRKLTKNVNFGLVYGMGVKKLIRYLGLTPAQGEELFEAYHKGVPFVQATMEATMNEAGALGYIQTILGRRSRFELFEPSSWDDKRPGLPLDAALKYYGSNIRRAYLHKGLNRRLQGSAADMMKRAMWLCWKDGVFDATGVPRLTVHDELDFSDTGGCDEAFAEMQQIMERCIPLRVPVIADCEVGPNWGNVE